MSLLTSRSCFLTPKLLPICICFYMVSHFLFLKLCRLTLYFICWPVQSFFRFTLTVINQMNCISCLYIPLQKSGWVLCYTLRTVWVSVRPFVRASFPDSNLSSFWPIFFKLCMDIDIGVDWFGIANGLNLFINNRVMALDWCKNKFFLNIFRSNGWILIKFCVYIDIYKIHVVSNAHYFW